MINHIYEDIQWIHHCFDLDGVHMHLSQYLIGTDRRILIDAGSGHQRESVVTDIESALNGDSLEAILLTHSILPHTENLPQILDHWPDVRIIAATNAPTVVGLPVEAEPKILNDELQIAGHEFTFLDPLLTDIVGSNWILHQPSGTLFTAEGVGHYHRQSDCNSVSNEFSDNIPLEMIHRFQGDKLPFLAYIDPEKLRNGFASVIDSFDIERIAPMHGTPVATSDIEGYIERVIESATVLSDGWDPDQRIPGYTS